jgi:hypothetical protein
VAIVGQNSWSVKLFSIFPITRVELGERIAPVMGSLSSGQQHRVGASGTKQGISEQAGFARYQT